MGGDHQLVASVESPGAHHQHTGQSVDRIEEAGGADRTGMLNIGLARRAPFVDCCSARHLEPLFRQEEVQAERAPRSRLAVSAVTGVDLRQLLQPQPVTHLSTAAPAFDRLDHDRMSIAAGSKVSSAAGRQYKSMFFSEKAADRTTIDYAAVNGGSLQLTLAGEASKALEKDYARMVGDGLLVDDAEPFEALMARGDVGAARVNCAGA